MVALRTNSMHDIELRDVQLTLTKIYLTKSTHAQ